MNDIPDINMPIHNPECDGCEALKEHCDDIWRRMIAWEGHWQTAQRLLERANAEILNLRTINNVLAERLRAERDEAAQHE